MQGAAATRAALGAKGIWAEARLPGRSERFAGRSDPERPDFATLARWPCWMTLSEDRRLRIGGIAALLAACDALAEEIDGVRLRAYAEFVGADTLDAVLDAGGVGGASLPPPEALAARAGKLLAASLDASAARLSGVEPQHDVATTELVLRAESLCRGIDRE